MKLTRRGLFATLAAAFVAKPAIVHAFDHIGCNCPGCQWARGSLIRAGGFAARAPNQLLTMQEITYKSLQELENNICILPNFYRDPA